MVAAYLAAAVAHARDDLRVVAVASSSLGLPDGVFFRGVPDSGLQINESGRVAFSAVTELGGSRPEALFVEDPDGALDLVAVVGGAAPSFGAGAEFFEVRRQGFNEAGESAFLATVDLGAERVDGVFYRDADGDLRTIIQEGDQAPGFGPGVSLAPRRLNGGLSVGLSDKGHLLFTGTLQGDAIDASNDGVVYRYSESEGFGVLSRQGDVAPFPGADAIFDFTNLHKINSSGDVAFIASVSVDRNGVREDASAVYQQTVGGELELVAYSGQTAPGFASDAVIGDLSNLGGGEVFIDDQGGALLSTSVDLSHDRIRAYYRTDSEGGLELLAHEGGVAPGLGPDAEINLLPLLSSFALLPLPGVSPVLFDLDVSDNGTLAFIAGVETPDFTGRALYTEREGELAVVALEVESGEAPANLPFPLINDLANPIVNDHGQVAFLGSSTFGPDAIYVTDRNGDLRVVAELGGEVDLSEFLPDASSYVFSSFEEFFSRSLSEVAINNQGQVAFEATAAPTLFGPMRYGVFVSDVGTIPEPATAGMVLPLLLALAGRRRRYA